MSIFWNYFKNGLKYALIWQPGPLATVVQGAADVLDSARESVLWVRDQFLPDRCEEENLDGFAASRGIVRAAYETDDQYYSRVRLAWHWYVLGGRESGIRRIVADACGIDTMEIINLRDTDPERWAEFRVRINNIQGDMLTKLPTMTWAINEVKPARSKLAGFELVLYLEKAQAWIGCGGPVAGAVTTVYPLITTEITLEPVMLMSAAAIQTGSDTIVYPKEPT
ncbi:phage tail protein [Desulforegula conservatrix]|uniref:phage tail protein n=1 Tax=Desulforegula conservatrix TaxID=153026 RepID=UPI000415B03E|nr:phage tail protein [Desulforegula conservatrix]